MKFTEECMMCMEKNALVKKMLTNGLNMGLPLQIEQRSVMKYLLAEKCKPCEIYRRMYDVYGEECFSKKNVDKWVKHGFATTNRTEVCHEIFVG